MSKGLYSYLADAQNFLLADLLTGGRHSRGGVEWLSLSLLFSFISYPTPTWPPRSRPASAAKPDMTWPEAVELVKDYGRALQGHLEDQYVTGRIKQWLNYLRRGLPEAETLK